MLLKEDSNVIEDIYSENEPVADLLVSDLSFISLTKVLPNLKTLLAPEFHEMICLIKFIDTITFYW